MQTKQLLIWRDAFGDECPGVGFVAASRRGKRLEFAIHKRERVYGVTWELWLSNNDGTGRILFDADSLETAKHYAQNIVDKEV
jgi:hypothetical protein